MNDLWLWMAIGSAFLVAYLSALHLSLDEFSKSELEDRLVDPRGKRRIEWLSHHLEELVLATAVLRRSCGVLLLVSTLWGLVPQGGSPSLQPMIWGAVGVFIWLWIAEIGLAWAISDHIATPLVRSALPWLPIMRIALLPFTHPLGWLNEVVRRLVGAKERDDLEDELRQVMEEGEREGQISETEIDMIEAIVDFRTATVDEIMTPRIDVEGIELTDNLDEIKEILIEAGHSRMPVFTENLDHIQGILYVKDLLPYLGIQPESFKLKPHLREALIIPESRPIRELLIEFQRNRLHMAIVVDEYGGTAGLVTIEDIVEEIVGEIYDEHEPVDETEPSFQRNDDGTVDVDGRLHIDDLNDELHFDLPEDADFDTVGGWVFSTLGRIPKINETFRINGLEVTILAAEKTRLNRLRLRPIDEDEDPTTHRENVS